MFYKNSPTPAFVGAQGENITQHIRKNECISFSENGSAADDFNTFDSSFSRPKNTERRTQNRAPRRPASNKKPTPENMRSIIIALAAVAIAVVLLIIIVAAVVSSDKSIKFEDNVYLTYQDGTGEYHLLANGKELEKYDNPVDVIPAADNSFAYIFETHPEGNTTVSYIEGKKITEITQTPVEVLTYAEYAPGIVYKAPSNGLIYIATKSDGDLITRNANSSSFIISGDASTVVYNEIDESGNVSLKIYNSKSNPRLAGTLQPEAISIDGSMIYASATKSDFSAKNLYVFEEKGDGYEDHNVCQGFEEILEMNADGDEIVFTAPTNSGLVSYVYKYKSGNPDKYEPLMLGQGQFKSISIDGSVACFDTYKDQYFEKVTAASDEAFSVVQLKKFNETPAEVSRYAGKFTPNGDFYYYTHNQTLYKVDLADLDEPPVEIYQDASDFEVTAKGNVYILDSAGQLRFHKGNSKNNEKKLVENGSDVADISMHQYANRLYMLSGTTLAVSACEEGTVKDSKIKLDSDIISAVPKFLNPNLKKSYVVVYDDTTADYSLYYTSNGKSFKAIEGHCLSISGVTPENYID